MHFTDKKLMIAREGWVWRRFENSGQLDAKKTKWLRRYLRWNPVDEVLSLHKYSKSDAPAIWKISGRQLASITTLNESLRDQIDGGFLTSLKRQWMGVKIPRNTMMMQIRCRNDMDKTLFDLIICGETIAESDDWFQLITKLVNANWYSSIIQYVPLIVSKNQPSLNSPSARKSKRSSFFAVRGRSSKLVHLTVDEKAPAVMSVPTPSRRAVGSRPSTLRNDITSIIANRPVSPFDTRFKSQQAPVITVHPSSQRIRDPYLAANTASTQRAGKSTKNKRASKSKSIVRASDRSKKSLISKNAPPALVELENVMNQLQVIATKRNTANSKRDTMRDIKEIVIIDKRKSNVNIQACIDDLETISRENSAFLSRLQPRESQVTIDQLTTITSGSEFFLSVLHINRVIAKVLEQFDCHQSISDTQLESIHAEAEQIASQFQQLEATDEARDLHRNAFADFQNSMDSLKTAAKIHDHLMAERALRRIKSQVNELRSVHRFSSAFAR